MEVMYCSCCGSQNVIGRPSCWKCSTMFSSMTANNGTDSFQGHGIVAGSHPLPPPSLIQSQVSQAVAPGLPGACNAAGATDSACAGFPVPLGPGCFKNLRVAHGSDQGGQPLQKHEILFDPNGPQNSSGTHSTRSEFSWKHHQRSAASCSGRRVDWHGEVLQDALILQQPRLHR